MITEILIQNHKKMQIAQQITDGYRFHSEKEKKEAESFIEKNDNIWFEELLWERELLIDSLIRNAKIRINPRTNVRIAVV